MEEKEIRGCDDEAMRGRMRSDRRFSFLYALLFTTLLLCRGAFASDMPPDVVGSTPVTPLLAGIRVGQVAGNYVFVHFRGFEIPHPRVVSEPGGAKLTLQWDGIRFPQNKDRRDWWNGYDWDVLRLNLKTGERWWRQYDYPLLNRADAEPVSGDAVRITFTSPRALMLDKGTVFWSTAQRSHKKTKKQCGCINSFGNSHTQNTAHVPAWHKRYEPYRRAPFGSLPGEDICHGRR